MSNIRFNSKFKNKPFESYNEYMEYMFACVNYCMKDHIKDLMQKYDAGQGQYKNVMYPDIEIAHNLCDDYIDEFNRKNTEDSDPVKEEAPEDDSYSMLDDELLGLLGDFVQGTETEEATAKESAESDGIEAMMDLIDSRIAVTDTDSIFMPFYELVKKRGFDHFSTFALAAAVISSTQTAFASVFQIVNESGSYTAPTIESAARLFFGHDFAITKGYSAMSICLENLQPVMDLRVNSAMPFSTVLAPDKRLIDYLFSKEWYKLDENFSRFISYLTDDKELDPIMANSGVLEAMEISYNTGVRIFSWYGDEGTGRKFFIKHFAKKNDKRAIVVNCKKLFTYDHQFIDKAYWSAARECIFADAYCCFSNIEFRDEEKERILGYVDLGVTKLRSKGVVLFFVSRDKLPLKEVTSEDFTELELPTPSNAERIACWEYYSKGYDLGEDVSLEEMATKFLFSPGKVAGALHQARSYAVMEHEDKISRAKLFKGCNNQMSSELSQKASRVEAKFGFEDIVMNESQRETICHAIEQMQFKKQVYDDWNYTKKYPYGRGLTVLLFGAPGTGKSMMAQVIAHELNLELYRVDISKVVDKYVGETEKSLSMIFREAKKCNVVLFFDECDTIFAKRSDDGGSNQSSNNNKTALLLQEMEAYDGVCVLATNYKHNIDPAFFRRMKYIVEFQFPDPDTREMLWKTTIPKSTPLADDVDVRFLAERFEFVGGNIKNCILNAAFLAAADPEAGGLVHMKHYLNAIKYEFVKTGKVFTKADFEPYAHLVGLRSEFEEFDDY